MKDNNANVEELTEALKRAPLISSFSFIISLFSPHNSEIETLNILDNACWYIMNCL